MNTFSRRRFTAIVAGSVISSILPRVICAQTHTQSTRILVVGDSLSAEYGLARHKGWVEQLKLALAKERPTAVVMNASISGDTTSGGVSRLSALLTQHAPTQVMIELGANDALRGLPLEMTQTNLAKMIALAQAANAEVILIGMQIPPNYGRQYAERFKNLFAELAASTSCALVPFLFEGFADQREYFQADGIHPNESAQALMLKNVRVALDRLLP